MAKQRKYAIIDIETTGGMVKRDKITEIAIVLHDGNQVIDQFDSLINPGRSIPPEITRITGITNEMVQDAPKFFEVAKRIVEITDGAIFVAHNVRFDYGFIKRAFEELGYSFNKKQLCTVRLTRKAFPGLRSYSLGNLIRHFGIHTDNRHRALDDTLATVEIFEKILAQNSNLDSIKAIINHGVKATQLPKGLSMDTLHELPEETGVYYFYDQFEDLIYIGKAINIKKRVFQHFKNKKRKGDLIHERVTQIDHEITGSELIALLKEAEEIKREHPSLNKALKKRFLPYFLGYDDKAPVPYFVVRQNTDKNNHRFAKIKDYASAKTAKLHLEELMRSFNVCSKYAHVHKFQYECMNCHEGCEKLSNDIIAQIETLTQRLFERDMLIFDVGRSDKEKSVILIQDGRYRGYAYINVEEQSMGTEEILETIKPISYHPIYNQLIWNHLKTNRLKAIYLS